MGQVYSEWWFGMRLRRNSWKSNGEGSYIEVQLEVLPISCNSCELIYEKCFSIVLHT